MNQEKYYDHTDYVLKSHIPNVETQFCKKCKKERPLDWFWPNFKFCWKCRGIHKTLAEERIYDGRNQTNQGKD